MKFKRKVHVACMAGMLLTTSLPTWADSYAQSTRLSLALSNVAISDVFTSVEQKSEYVFFYADAIREKLGQNVSVNLRAKTIDEILNHVLKGTGLTYVVNDRQIVITQESSIGGGINSLEDKGITINGTVRDPQQEPLIGVNVHVKGTTIGTVTDMNGNYFLEVPNQNAVLEFSYIGFQTHEVRVGPAQLQQGTTRAVSNNLAGQLAGVIAVQRSGEPGADGSDFWIRGISSFQDAGRTPLVLVDGIERTLDDLSAAEIESFSVLKDAAASAVYGVRGANGVIIVKTKRGQLGKPQVNVHFEQGFTQPVKLPDYIGSADYLSLLDEVYMDAGNPNPIYGEKLINKYRSGEDPELYPDVNWLDAISKDMASNSRGDITITGGSDILRYALVASYYGERGIFERDKSQSWDSSTRLNKYNVRSNVDINVTKTTTVSVSIGGYLQEQNGLVQSVQDIWNYAFDTPPFVHPIQYSDGRNVRVQQRQNPWAEVTQHGYKTTSKSKVESLFSVEQDLKFITEGLKIKGLFSFDRYSESWVKRSRTPTYYNPASGRDPQTGELILAVGTDGQEFLGTEAEGEWGNKATYLEANLTYDRTFGKHAVNGMFLYNQRDYNDGSVVPFRRMGIAGRASYTYDNKYIAEFNFGYNGSENFAKGQRFGFFPSVAVGYLMSEEKFMEPIRDAISKLKFRASWGLTGNDQLNGRRFAYIPTIDEDGAYKWGVNNDFNRSSRFEGEFGVDDLTWETVEKLNVGMELGLWNSLDFQIDWFKEQRRDIFMQRNNIPTAAGFRKTPWANFGKVDNGGVDISLNYNKQFNKNLHVGLRGTFTFARNKVIEMDEAMGVIGTNRQHTGHRVDELFGLIAEGLFTEDDFITNEQGEQILKEDIPSHTFSTVRPGDIRYKDVDGDGAITTKDKVALGGTINPEIVYGFGATARYKNVDFNIFFQGNGRTYRFIGGVASNFLPGSSQGAMGNIFSNYNDRWTKENPSQDVFYPRLSWGVNANNSQESTWWYRNMSMLRVKDIEVGYSFPKQWVSKIGLANLRLYAKGSNLFTFSQFDLWDPELDTNNGAKYPIMKSFSVGLDVNF